MPTQLSPITGTFVADRHHSSVLFTVGHMKVSLFRASFGDIDARLAAEDGRLALEGSAQVASISIGPEDFRTHVVDGADFFDGRNFPGDRLSLHGVPPRRRRHRDGRGRADDQGHQAVRHRVRALYLSEGTVRNYLPRGDV